MNNYCRHCFAMLLEIGSDGLNFIDKSVAAGHKPELLIISYKLSIKKLQRSHV